MRSAPKVNNFASIDYDTRLEIGQQMLERRNKLGLTAAELAEAAKVSEKNLLRVECGESFDESHDTVCEALLTIERLENPTKGRSHLRLV